MLKKIIDNALTVFTIVALVSIVCLVVWLVWQIATGPMCGGKANNEEEIFITVGEDMLSTLFLYRDDETVRYDTFLEVRTVDDVPLFDITNFVYSADSVGGVGPIKITIATHGNKANIITE